jgi:uroporphyrinogen-III synthase
MRLLVTRPEPDATRTAAALRARGHEVLVAPLLATQTIEAEFDERYDAVLMTSANAARAASRQSHFAQLRKLPVVTVGHRTAEIAQTAGFTQAGSPGGSLADLVAFVPTIFGAGSRLLYLAGEDRAGDLAAELGRHGVIVDTVVIYRAVAAEKLPPHLTQALQENALDAALHYSRRSVATLLTFAGQAGAVNTVTNLAHYCLSAEVATPLREAGANRIAVAARPDEASLLALIPE